MRIEGRLVTHARKLIRLAGSYLDVRRPVTISELERLADEKEDIKSCIVDLTNVDKEKVLNYAVYKFILSGHAATLAAIAGKYLDTKSPVTAIDLESLAEEKSDVMSVVSDFNERDRKKVFKFVASKWLQSQEVISEVQEALLAELARENVKSDTSQDQNPGSDQDTKV